MNQKIADFGFYCILVPTSLEIGFVFSGGVRHFSKASFIDSFVAFPLYHLSLGIGLFFPFFSKMC